MSADVTRMKGRDRREPAAGIDQPVESTDDLAPRGQALRSADVSISLSWRAAVYVALVAIVASRLITL